MKRVRWAILAACALLVASCGQAGEAPAPDQQASEPAPSATAGTTDLAGADDRTFCAEVGRRISQEACDDYVRLSQSAERGVAAFNAPTGMKRGEAHTLQLAISFAPPEPPAPATEAPDTRAQEQPSPPAPSQPSDGRERASPAPPAQTPHDTVEGLPGDTVEFQPLVGRFMRAELSGAGFAVTSQSPASQEVTPDSVTTWTWQVVAKQGGEQALTLKTVVEGCTEGGECVPLRSTTQNYTVNVQVGPVDQAKDFLTGVPDWIKLVSAIVGALAGLLLAWVGLRNAFKKTRE